MANINFILRDPYKKNASELVRENKKKGKRIDKLFNPDETPILMIFGYDRSHRFKCKTDLNVRAGEWDFKKQRKKSKLTGNYELNGRLDELHKDVTDFYNGLISARPDITFKQVQEKITEFIKEHQTPNFEEGEPDSSMYLKTILRKIKIKSHRGQFRSIILLKNH